MAAESSYTISWSASSDRLYHGVTETTHNPNLSVAAEYHAKGNWFVGARAQAARADFDNQRHRNIDGYIGYDARIQTSAWSWGTALKLRRFINAAKEWDYEEVSVHLRHDNGFSFTVDYADNYYAHNTRAAVAIAGYTYSFASKPYYLKAQAGRSELLDRFNDHSFASFGAGWFHGQSSIEASYNWHDARWRFGDAAQSSGWLLVFNHRWR